MAQGGGGRSMSDSPSYLDGICPGVELGHNLSWLGRHLFFSECVSASYRVIFSFATLRKWWMIKKMGLYLPFPPSQRVPDFSQYVSGPKVK